MSDCLFCKIVKGEIPAAKVYEDEIALAFKDIQPEAPHHVLIVPKKHIPTLNDLTPEDEKLAGHLLLVASKVAEKLGVAQSGYRLALNTNADAGQIVFHLHLHFLGGRGFGWPPG